MQAFAMMIEVMEFLYSNHSPSDRGKCYVFPPRQQNGAVAVNGQSTTATINRDLRASLVAATGQPYVIHIGPFKTADGKTPVTIIFANTTSKGYRKALIQRCILKGMTVLAAKDLQRRASSMGRCTY